MSESLSNAQLKALAIIPKITASISIPCSLTIIYEVVNDHRRQKNKRGRASQRALLGMSCVDVCASFGWFLSTWAVPRNESSEVYSTGTQGSCTFQGFLLQLAIGAPSYNACLALTYMLIIRYGWTDEELLAIEPWLHGTIILFAVGTSIACIPLGLYNPIRSVCWIMGKPRGCGESSPIQSSVECIRGDHAWIYGISLFYAPLGFYIMFVTCAMIAIYAKVKKTERQSSRFYTTTTTSTSTAMGSHARRGRSRRHTLLQSENVAQQALLYTVAFYITWIPSFAWAFTHWFNVPMFWLDLLQRLTEPSQGILNFLVFLSPRKVLQARLKRRICKLCCCRTIELPQDLSNQSRATSSVVRWDNNNFIPNANGPDENDDGEQQQQDGTTVDHVVFDGSHELTACATDEEECKNELDYEYDDDDSDNRMGRSKNSESLSEE